MEDISVVSEAKREYTSYLCHMIIPHAIDVFSQMYDEAKGLSKGKQILIQYQKLLREVPNWNNNMVKQHCESIVNSCSMFTELLGAVFVSYIKVMSTVRINNTAQKISIKVPSNDVFVHRCYIAMARDLYSDPYIMHDKMTDYAREYKLNSRFSACVSRAIQELLPINEILSTYMRVENKNEETVETFDDLAEKLEDGDDIETEKLPGEDYSDELMETDPVPEIEEDGEEDVEKSIPVTGKGVVQPPEVPGVAETEEDVLFADAPDKKVPVV